MGRTPRRTGRTRVAGGAARAASTRVAGGRRPLRLRHRPGHRFRVFGVAVGAPLAAGAGSVLEALSDNLRSVGDFTDVHAAVGLFRWI
ncbi:hypothetical protein GA0115241_11089 [Streptomyces sp. DpondAA-D4]|nr:hypothetical protein GA0115241_11089 [Streptomyces sp. DpondAA-D4]